MASVEDHLQRWSEAGLVDAATSDRIREFERQQRSQPAKTAREDLPGVTEAVLYLGIAVVVAGAIILTGENWDDLQSWARIAATGVPAALTLFAGMALRSLDKPYYHRAASLAWLATVPLAAGAVVVSAAEADVDEYLIFLIFGVTATVVAAALWAANPRTLQLLALGGGLFMLATGVANSMDEYSSMAMGMTLFGAGALGVALSEMGLLEPKRLAQTIFAAFAIFGPFIAGTEGTVYWAESMVFVVGAALITLAVRRNAFAYMVIAVAGMFIGLINFVFEHLADTIGAALSLLLCGAAIIGGVLLLAVMRSSTRGQTK